MTGFLHKLIDWKEFELFVADLYKSSEELQVRHNVTETGKSGALRQIDVLVIQKTKLHTLKTIIECKRWKQKVDRQVIDVLAASIKDLGANKGVIFTTVGYEEGAVQYAKSENIDVLVVREIKDDEWGKPGRHISFYIQYYNATWNGFKFGDARFRAPSGLPMKQPPDLVVGFTKDQTFPEHLDLYTSENMKGINLVKLLIDTRNYVLDLWSRSFGLLEPTSENPVLLFDMHIKLDLTTYPFKFLRHEDGYISFNSIDVVSRQSISQTKFEFDKASSSDIALVVENYITNQRNYASKDKKTGEVKLSNPIVPSDISDDKILKNGSIMKVILDYYVGMQFPDDTPVEKLPDLTVNVQGPVEPLASSPSQQ